MGVEGNFIEGVLRVETEFKKSVSKYEISYSRSLGSVSLDGIWYWKRLGGKFSFERFLAVATEERVRWGWITGADYTGLYKSWSFWAELHFWINQNTKLWTLGAYNRAKLPFKTKVIFFILGVSLYR